MVLAGTILNRSFGGGVDRALYDTIMRILDDRGVTVLCDLPGNVNSSEILIYGDGARFVEGCARTLDVSASARVEMLSRESLRYTNLRPEEALATTSVGALDTAVRRELATKGIDLSDFATDYATKGGDGNFFFQYVLDYKGKLVFDSSVSVMVNQSGGITELTINYREIKAAARDKLMKVMPVYQVILKNYYESGDAISQVNIGFMGQNTSRENPFIESEEGAVWRMRLDDGTERFFEAAYGDEIYLYAED
jgi:hypothetical protein